MMTTVAGDDTNDNSRRTDSRLLSSSTSPSENWDDDFEFQAGVVAGARGSAQDAMNAPTHSRHAPDQEESWDDAYEDENTQSSPIKRTSKVEEDDVEDWDSSDNELETHDQRHHDIRHEQTREFGLGGFEEEDKTVTARSTSSRPRDPPPVLPLPIPPTHHFQAHTVLPSSTTSPTLSTFSIPLSSTTRDHASIYSQDPLMPSSNSSAPHLSVMRSYPHAAGSTPPRKGRRLRKKSRPPEADIFELEDHEPNPIPAPVPPVITTQYDVSSPTTPPHAQPTILESPSRPSQPSAPPTPSSSLLTRIGSFKRWARRSMGPDDPVLSGWRRSKSSTGPGDAKSSHGPSDVLPHGGKSSTGPEGRTSTEEGIDLGLRPASPTPAPARSRMVRRSRGDSASGQKSGWFFRAGGAAGSEREEVTPTVQTPEITPSKRGTTLGLRRRSKARGEGEDDVNGEGKTPTPRKLKAKLVPALKAEGAAGLDRQGEPVSPTRPSRRSLSRDPTDSRSHNGSRPMSMLFPRTGNGNASVGRKAGAGLPVTESASTGSAVLTSVQDGAGGDGKTHGESRDRDGGRESGMRGLMHGVRRLSLVGAAPGHKRTKSTGGGDGAEEAPKKDVATRPRSRTDHRVGGVKVDQSSLHPPIMRFAPNQGDGNGLLPPIELEPSSMSGMFARRGSLPWTDYDRPSGVEPHAVAAAGSSLQPLTSVTDQHHPSPNRQSYSTASSSPGATSRNSDLGSPMNPSHSPIATLPIPVPVPRKSADTVPQSRPLASTVPTEQHSGLESREKVQIHPHSPSKLPMPSSPQSASLGRSTASPSHSTGLRRNSLGDLKTPLNTLGEHKAQLPPLGELKIPARISRAQQGLKRDMGMVREFAGCVEQLKRLQSTYVALLGDMRAAYDASPGSSPPGAAHVQFHLPSRPPSQIGTARKTITSSSNASVQSIHQMVSLNSPSQLHPRTISRASHDISRELVRLEHEYGIWWECAELLIELGGGSGVAAGAASNLNLAALSTSTVNTPAEDSPKLNSTEEQQVVARQLTHVSSMSEPGSLFEQALSSASNSKGPPQASPPHLSRWRASTGRHDLSARQLRLLRDMLNTPDPASLAHAAGPYGYGAGYPQPHVSTTVDAQPWATWNHSAVTLPSEESSADVHSRGATPATETREEGKEKKRRASRLGMLGLREILRGLKRTAIAEGRLDTPDRPAHGHQSSESSVSNIAEDDHYNRRRSPWHQHDEHHAAKLSTGPELTAPLDNPPTRTHAPKSPRRPSLASIFRIGTKNVKSTTANAKFKDGDASPNGNGTSTPEDERVSALAAAATEEYADWERMSRSDLDLTAIGPGTSTVRAKKSTRAPTSRSSINLNYPYSNANGVTPKKTPATSQTSLWDSSPSSVSPQPSRLPLSITEEGGDRKTQRTKTPDFTRPKDLPKDRTSSWSHAHPPPRPSSRNGKATMSGTVRSAPPNDFSSTAPALKLALTPENIKPLLEYAREVGTRLSECINEVQILLGPSA